MKPALIIFKQENEEKVKSQIYDRINELIKEKEIEEETIFGSTQNVGDSNLRIQVLHIYNWFESYKEFDDFLIELVQECGLNDLEERGVMIGHIDENGEIWADYAKFAEKSESLCTKN